MNFIVLDLEWNQSPLGKGTEVKELPFEIIEIGAVMVDETFQIKSEFHEFIRPQLYKELHYKTKEIIQVEMERLLKADIFTNVISRFFNWCGENYIFCTWGAMDLTELQRNLNYYKLEQYINKPVKYYDIQKIFRLCSKDEKDARALEYAVDYLEIPKAEEFHLAINDARYTAFILKKLDPNVLRNNYSINYYRNPQTKEEEIYVEYEYYSKYISKEFDTKELALQDKDIRSTICHKCHKRANKKIRWFSVNAKHYYCIAYCKTHGYIKGKLRIKRTEDDKFFAVKTLKLVTEEEAEQIFLKKQEIVKRRREKRKKKNKG